MAGKVSSKLQQGHYSSYKSSNRQAINRKAKLERALKAAPNNEQIVAALKNIGYRRGTPKSSQWSHTSKYHAQLAKSFTKGEPKVFPDFSAKDMDKLFTRAHDGQGALVWNHS